MSKNMQAILYAICFLLMGLFLAGMRWLFTGINEDFGVGVGVGIFIGSAILLFASREVRKNSMIDY